LVGAAAHRVFMLPALEGGVAIPRAA
jgi:hypothetical protein